jgi:signal transduction histidine kinase
VDEGASEDELRVEVERLRASRARVVAIADGERRRIERSLHDGIQQHLVALAVNLQLAQELADSDPPSVKPLLDELSRGVREALENVRSLAHDVYPALLFDRGLAEALRGAAAEASVPTRVEGALPDRYPPDVEAAVYFCCVQALELAGRAGSETRAVLRVWPEGGSLRFEVAVTGGGADGPGAELERLADRLGALDGTLSASTEPGGIRITGAVPVRG